MHSRQFAVDPSRACASSIVRGAGILLHVVLTVAGGRLPRGRQHLAMLLVTQVSPFVVMAGCGDRILGSPVRLDLTIDNSYAVPDTFAISTVAAHNSGTLALLSDSQPYVLLGSNGTYVELGVGVLEQPIAAAFDTPSLLDVLDGARKSVIQFSDLRLVREWPLDVSGEIVAGMRLSDRSWLVLARDESRQMSLIQVVLGEAVRFQHLPNVPVDPVGRVRMLELPNGDLVLSDTFNPQRLVRVRLPTEILTRDLYDRSMERESGTLSPYWIAAGWVALDEFLVYTVADLRSDERRILLIDSNLNVIRETRLQAPFALVAHVPSEETAIGVRRLNAQELVFYRWRWGE